MKLLAMILCEKAIVREGMLHILGGGATILTRPELPAPLSVDLALMFQPASIDDLTAPHSLHVEIRSSATDRVATAEVELTLGLPGEAPSVLPAVPITIPLQNVGVSEYGLCTISVELDTEPVGTWKFTVEKEFPQGSTDALGMTH